MLPIRTSIYPKKTPYANYILIAINFFIFFLSMHMVTGPKGQQGLDLRNWAEQFMLFPDHPYIWQFVTYAFLHGGLWHILGNMYFLYLFGNNVNDKLGNTGYVCFYLAGAVFSGLGSALLSHNPILGASGAVAAVTGAYLVLYPKTLITVIIWYFYDTEIRAMYFIALKLILFDNILMADPSHGIAYNAHLAGYGFGIFAILGMLAIGLIPKDFNDLWSMLLQWNRRRTFRDAVSDGYDPYVGRTKKTVSAKVHAAPDKAPESEQAKKIMDLRSRISLAMSNHSNTAAANLYIELLGIDDSQTLPRQLQLDVANQLMAEGQWQHSAKAYERFLTQYKNYEFVEQVHLMLGLLYARYLNRPEEALKELKTAADRLTDPGQKNMCQQEINRLENA